MGKEVKENEKQMIERAIMSVRTRIEHIQDSSTLNNGDKTRIAKKIEIQEFIFDVLKFYESYISNKDNIKKKSKQKQIKIPENMIELPCTVNQLKEKYDKIYKEKPSGKYTMENDPYMKGYIDGVKKGRLMMLEYILSKCKYKGDYIV